ncbi:three-Cys-motif partner protein TcmP [Nocardia halotolerans]|uniref:Three-Cys-motif partner protein TcmP n=1 Tax=Nocardia halotolerans TaxID=1755878 RepID=A0ABV8VK58_9NOCA
MSKDSSPESWKMEPHTAAKHEILRHYLGAWFPILSKWNGRVLYIDGFAGRGRYDDGSEGSPQIALRRLLTHSYLPQMSNCEFVFFFIEKDNENVAALEVELDALKAEFPNWPANIKTRIINGSFDEKMNELFEQVREQNRQLAPTFAFIDPFGYTKFPMDLLAEIANTPKSELFINFMVGFVQRFIARDKQQTPMRELYGMEVADVLKDYDPTSNRIEHLTEVYAQSLRGRTKLPYIQRFSMVNKTGNVSYALIHATASELGVKRMKAAMWSVDPGGNYRFSDRTHGEAVLFEPTPDLTPLRAAVVEKFAGARGVTRDKVDWFVILETSYRETHVIATLTELEKMGKITVFRPPGKRGFSPTVTFDF